MDKNQTFPFELVPSRLKATSQLSKHFSSHNSFQLFSTAGNFLGIHPTPYLSLKHNSASKVWFFEKSVEWKSAITTEKLGLTYSEQVPGREARGRAWGSPRRRAELGRGGFPVGVGEGSVGGEMAGRNGREMYGLHRHLMVFFSERKRWRWSSVYPLLSDCFEIGYMVRAPPESSRSSGNHVQSLASHVRETLYCFG